jgi:uncharacterized membrane protein YoaK (UPF0700 family)
MPIAYLRHLTARERTRQANSHLAGFLAFIAGAINAGGFLAVRQYTSHMTGLLSSLADNIAVGALPLLFGGIAALSAFIIGAGCSAVLIHWARRRHLYSEYALPLVLEAGLLICFGMIGGVIAEHQWLYTPMTVSLLCFVMGLQNAMITKISKAEIRTTHVTGMITDIGIELGKLCYWNRAIPDGELPPVRSDRGHLTLLVSLVSLFFLGGIVGALGFKHVGYISTLPLAAMLIALASVPMMDDTLPHLRRIWRG